MRNVYDIVVQLTSSALSDVSKARTLNDFAQKFEWQPSDSLQVVSVSDFATAHLVVEHGLENTAVITFFRSPRRFSDLTFDEKKRLLNISYNNLVDWHIQVQVDEITYVYNLTDPPRIVESQRISRDSFEALRSRVFEQIAGKKPNPNLRALDDALIGTISFWKRNLSAEMGYAVSNEALSALFNAIIFARAAEDNFNRMHSTQLSERSQRLLEVLNSSSEQAPTLRDVILQTIRQFSSGEVPTHLINESILGSFDGLDRQTTFSLLSDFYTNKYAPYEYDFSLISKHALSRIYEHYVSILTLEESDQVALFPPLPEAQKNKAYGSVYTPQFIARFFARYLREQMPPLAFKRIKSIDPACGSGIFLRTLLEMQCDPTQDRITTELIQSSFEKVVGIDVDENACQAARLSLSLLYLVLTDQLPHPLKIVAGEAIEYYQDYQPELHEAFDAVLANPPFVSLATQSPAMRERIAEFMLEFGSGRIDMYLAYLRIALGMLRPGGYGLFVLPHSFLLGKNARKMRKQVSEDAWVRCLADLSAIPVFEDLGSYIILLIIQKRSDEQRAPLATIIKCQDLVGRALQEAVEGYRTETNLYSIYDVEQRVFDADEWIVLPPAESSLKNRLESFPKLDRFLQIRKGVISGRDEVFIIHDSEVPKGEDAIFVPFLPDREMKAYIVPGDTGRRFFYPYLDGVKIDEKKLKANFPGTWKYLCSNKEKLQSRRSLEKYNKAWWEPTWSRPPENIMRPKIVSPHLVLVPRFSIDRKGKYATAQGPLMYPKGSNAEDDLLRFFVAVLNSTVSYWYVSQHSHTYRGGYLKLEPMTLAKTPVPDPSKIPPTKLRKLLKLVDNRLTGADTNATVIENQIDGLVCEFYGLSNDERRAIGIEI